MGDRAGLPPGSGRTRRRGARSGRTKPLSYIQDKDVIFRILNHLNLLPEESPGTLGRSPPDDNAPAWSAEIVCEPFYEDLESGEVEEMMETVMNVGRN